ncbi:toxin-antitoxin system, toxin component, PIN family protein [Streptomyces thermoalcalitolerans]|uniref:VapC45 PIN like domain-containing protein n=1 Tax=Streptomyces thermoalcalitolerans TaxID=65605 RepID=A0ABP3Z796_9ACTN
MSLGWKLHLVADEFPDDGQQTPDEEWIEHALLRGWVPLCKDGRIRGRDRERKPIGYHAGVLFYLDNQSLRIEEMVQRIHQAQARIYQAVARGGPAIYAIKNGGITKTWPDA